MKERKTLFKSSQTNNTRKVDEGKRALHFSFFSFISLFYFFIMTKIEWIAVWDDDDTLSRFFFLGWPLAFFFSCWLVCGVHQKMLKVLKKKRVKSSVVLAKGKMMMRMWELCGLFKILSRTKIHTYFFLRTFFFHFICLCYK